MNKRFNGDEGATLIEAIIGAVIFLAALLGATAAMASSSFIISRSNIENAMMRHANSAAERAHAVEWAYLGEVKSQAEIRNADPRCIQAANKIDPTLLNTDAAVYLDPEEQIRAGEISDNLDDSDKNIDIRVQEFVEGISDLESDYRIPEGVRNIFENSADGDKPATCTWVRWADASNAVVDGNDIDGNPSARNFGKKEIVIAVVWKDNTRGGVTSIKTVRAPDASEAQREKEVGDEL